MVNNDSPYLKENNRLADVIAAIQAMGTYKFYKLDFEEWEDRITGDETTANHWQVVYEEHPEFFRLDSKKEKASLVWRRQQQKLFNVDTEQKISRKEFDNLSGDKKIRISRIPLGSNEISTLINTAINIHSRALEHKQDTRWWIPTVAGLAGVVLGTLITVINNII